jgi:hypothetical protein
MSAIDLILDVDTSNFITAAQLNNILHYESLDYLVTELKRVNIWNKMKAIYPFIGGTAFTHKFNLKDPRDLDVAFRLSFNGTLTHSSTGCKGNGSSGYCNTFLVPNGTLSTTNSHLSFYSLTDITETAAMMGARSVPQASYLLYTVGKAIYPRLNDDTNNITTLVNTRGFHLASKTLSNNGFYQYNNTPYTGILATVAFTVTKSITLLAWNNTAGITNYSSKECAFASIGDGLTDTDALNLYNIVQQYQTLLGRQV